MANPDQPGKILVLATGNRGKVKEFQSLLASGGFEMRTPADIGFAGDVEESGTTLLQNALIKAQALAAHSPYPVLSDDTGLEVDALGGAPGVHSARYAEAEYAAAKSASAAAGSLISPAPVSQAAANRSKLLKAMAGKSDRRARFRCVLCYLVPGEEPVFFQGECEGRIAIEERGQGGFGYDSLFIPKGYDKTFGELSESIKDSLSHRARAASLFLQSLSSE